MAYRALKAQDRSAWLKKPSTTPVPSPHVTEEALLGLLVGHSGGWTIHQSIPVSPHLAPILLQLIIEWVMARPRF
jgi:hypothetical protein